MEKFTKLHLTLQIPDFSKAEEGGAIAGRNMIGKDGVRAKRPNKTKPAQDPAPEPKRKPVYDLPQYPEPGNEWTIDMAFYVSNRYSEHSFGLGNRSGYL